MTLESKEWLLIKGKSALINSKYSTVFILSLVTNPKRVKDSFSYFSQLQNLTPNMSFTYPSILQ